MQVQSIILKKHLNGDRPCAIFKALKHLNINRDFVYKTIKRYNETGTIDYKKRTGRKRTVRTAALLKVVRERVRRDSRRSIRKLAKDLKQNRGTIYNILKSDLHCRAYKKRKVHGVSEATSHKRFDRAAHLLAWHAGDEFVFSDEKLFVLQQPHNSQNDRLWSVSIHDIPDNQKNIPRFQSAAAVMVWGGSG